LIVTVPHFHDRSDRGLLLDDIDRVFTGDHEDGETLRLGADDLQTAANDACDGAREHSNEPPRSGGLEERVRRIRLRDPFEHRTGWNRRPDDVDIGQAARVCPCHSLRSATEARAPYGRNVAALSPALTS
jgi:hypothetical protein